MPAFFAAALVAGAAVSAGSSAYSASQNKKSQQRSLEARQQAYGDLSDADKRNIFGSVPELPDFIPVDLTQSQRDTVRGNLSTFSDADRLASKVGEANLDIDLDRARSILPNFDEIVASQSQNIAALNRGELPFDDVMDIVSDRAQVSNRLGLAGSGIGTNATLRDLGLSRLQAQQTGQNMFQSFMQNAASSISPLSRQGDVRDSFLSPAQRAQMDVQQRIQSFNAETMKAQAEAMPDPIKSQMFFAEMGDDSQAAALRGQNVWVAPAMQAVGSAATQYGTYRASNAQNEALLNRQIASNQVLASQNPYSSDAVQRQMLLNQAVSANTNLAATQSLNNNFTQAQNQNLLV